MAEAKTTAPVEAGKKIDVKGLLAAGAHFGHQTRRWNPKMAPYIFTAKNGIHVIDLTKTEDQIKDATKQVKKICAQGGVILFVGTKRQARPIVSAAAAEAGMPYVVHRWLGGMLTNLDTIAGRITAYKRMIESKKSGEFEQLTKKEQSRREKKFTQLNKLFIGLTEMNQLPAAIFVVDVPREEIAIAEAHRLNIPVFAITDTNANPDQVDHVIAANDDAIKSIDVITRAIAAAAAEGAAEFAAKSKEVKKEDEK